MKKRLLAILMILSMTLLAGVSSAEVTVSEPGVLPIVNEPVTLRFLVTEHPAIIDWNTNEFILWMEEQTGVHIEFDYVPLKDRQEKLNLILATGNYPDVFFGMGGSFSNAAFQQYGVQEGLLLPLNDLIDTYAIEAQKIFEQFPGSRGLITQLDGNIYSMPGVNECYHCTMADKFWINQTWLDNLGLEKPTTIDAFYDVLVAFRDNDANGNGDPNDEIPLAGSYVTGWMTTSDLFILNAFTHYDLALGAEFTGAQVRSFGMYLDDDGNIVVPFDDPALRDGLKFIRKLYDEGLYYPGSFTQDLDQLTQLAENESANLLGATGGGYIHFAQMGGDRYREYDYLLPLTGPDGFQNVIVWPHDSVFARNFVISVDCKYPEVAIRWADFCLTLEASLRAYYGVENVDWKWAAEGGLGINGEPAIYDQLTPWQEVDPQNQHITQYGLDKRDAAYRLGMSSPADIDLYSPDGLETFLYQATKAYEPYGNPARTLPPIKFTADKENELMVIRTELSNAIKEGMIGFMTGTRDVDTEYDAFLADLEAKGLRTLITAFQEGYDAQFK